MDVKALIRGSSEHDRDWILDVLVREWHGPLIERADEFIDASKLPCLIAELDGERVGLVTLLEGPDFVEIITLNSFQEGKGIGKELIDATVELARSRGASDVRLFTTNDNLHALGFYQRRGFVLYALHRDTITRARQVKPQIPQIGRENIPLRDEIELRLPLAAKVQPSEH